MNVVIILNLLVLTWACPTYYQWTDFKMTFNKSYASLDEEYVAVGNFFTNMEKVEKHNEKFYPKKLGYTKGPNKFADLSVEEILRFYTGFRRATDEDAITLPIDSDKEVPDLVDWRNDGIVGDVKNQGNCSSSWAFSAVAALEGLNAQITGNLIQLSEQNLLDCSNRKQSHGCDGGDLFNAFNHVKSKGIDSEKDYPYDGKKNKCRSSKRNIAPKFATIYKVEAGNEEALKFASSLQIVSVAIQASKDFLFYTGGIFNESCSQPAQLNHALAIVGYGRDKEQDFWIARNSWGDDWGENGYIRIKRGENLCGIADAAYIPSIKRISSE